MKNILKNPDMSFCNFMISFCMFMISLITFYSHRDFNNEYFNRQLIYKKLIDNALPVEPLPPNYMEIKNMEDFKYFMNTTVAMQIFQPQKAIDMSLMEKNNDTDNPLYDKLYKSPYIFQHGIVPLGKMRLRQ